MGRPIWAASGPDTILGDGFAVLWFLDHLKERDRDQKTLHTRSRGDRRSLAPLRGRQQEIHRLFLGMSFHCASALLVRKTFWKIWIRSVSLFGFLRRNGDFKVVCNPYFWRVLISVAWWTLIPFKFKNGTYVPNLWSKLNQEVQNCLRRRLVLNKHTDLNTH